MTSQIVIATELLVAGRGDHPRGIFSVSVFSTFLVVLKVQGLASLLPPLFLWTSFVFQFEGSDMFFVTTFTLRNNHQDVQNQLFHHYN
tara:strand:- start:2290 stop:2553 length:264 start_codon:yes stop_codon:yes gene_type:complete